MKILVTGTDGYIGAILAPRLMRAGHEVLGVDTGLYRNGWLFSDSRLTDRAPLTLSRDIRQLTADVFAGCDAVVHMAELSNDPLGQNNPAVTYRVNHEGSLRIARLARQAGVPRFVYTSSCSVYGAGTGAFLDETAATNPQTAYAECKVMVERDVGAMASDDFSPVFLRNATAFGASPRMRFDIVLNNLAAHAWTSSRIAMTSDGTPWRPLVHVEDICRAVECAVGAPAEAVHNQVFNVGSDEQNYRVREIAEIVGRHFPGCEVSMGDSSGDNRSYRVSFAKIHRQLPGFGCDWDAEAGAAQLRELFERIEFTQADFDAAPFTRLRQLQWLLDSGQVDADLFWTH